MKLHLTIIGVVDLADGCQQVTAIPKLVDSPVTVAQVKLILAPEGLKQLGELEVGDDLEVEVTAKEGP